MDSGKIESPFRKKNKMSEEVGQAIVNGILQGYKNYLDERKAKRSEMKISTAYAWVRGIILMIRQLKSAVM